MRASNAITGITLLTAAGMIGLALWRVQPLPEIHAEELAGLQAADEPLLLPADGEPRHRLHLFSAWQLAEIPTATRFTSPMGSERGALTYNAQKFWDMNAQRGGYHTGDDLNGIGGMNTDLGDPVYAAADGRVVFSGEPSPGWGKVIVIAHRDVTGRTLQSMYARHCRHGEWLLSRAPSF
jgi:murein DD-endopeptidase MepM/ murein hydrolase activator NlpD